MSYTRTAKTITVKCHFTVGPSIEVYASSAPTNTVINTMVASDSDSYVDGITAVYYSLSSGPGPSWIHGNILFALNISMYTAVYYSTVHLQLSLVIHGSWKQVQEN